MELTAETFSLIIIVRSSISASIAGYTLLLTRRKKNLESKRDSGPTNKRGTWVTVIFLLCVLSVCLYIQITTPEEGINNVTSLCPGSHFVDRVPFIVNVDRNEVAILTKHFWYYDIEYHKVTVISRGYLGLRYTNKNGIWCIHEILQPGIYRIDLDKYKVNLFKMDPQTFKFGN